MFIQIDNFIQKISHKDSIVELKYSPSGKFLISADRSGEIIIWSRGESKDVKLIQTSYSPLTGIWFSEDEKWLISGYQGGNTLIYNFPEMNLEAEIKLKTDYPEGYILSGTSRPTLNWVVLVVGPLNDLNFYAVLEFRDFFTIRREDFKVIRYNHFPGSLIEYTVSSPDGKLMFFGDDLGYIYNFSIPEKKLKTYAKHQEKVKAFDLSMRPTTMYTSTGIAALALSNDNKFLASTSRSGGVQLWDTDIHIKEDLSLMEFQPIVAKEPVRDFWIRGVCFIPNSSNLVLGSDDGTLEIWNYQLKHSKYIGKCPTGVRSLDISPDSLQIAIGCEDGGIFLIPLHEFFQ
jgi:WD40 repeat protein